jgi:hypothetical protein
LTAPKVALKIECRFWSIQMAEFEVLSQYSKFRGLKLRTPCLRQAGELITPNYLFCIIGGEEMFSNRVIGWWHDQFFQLPEVHPLEVTTPHRFERAFLNPTAIDQKQNRIFWIGMEDRIEHPSHLHLNIQLLL